MNNVFRYFIITIFFAAILIWIVNLQKPQTGLSVIFCDVGEGDATFIRFPNSDELLIDGGPNNSVLNCIGENMSFYDRKIRSIMITHPDADHITGLVELLNRYEVDEIYLTGIKTDNLIYQKVLSIIKQKQIAVKYVYAGESFKYGDLSLKIIYPYQNLRNQTVSNTNETSIVSRLEDGKVSYLFTGDIDKSTADKILANNPSLIKSTVLKIPHHGSKDFSQEFFKYVNPEISVISVGAKNRYGHPSKELLNFLAQNNYKYLRTDERGTIKIESDGKKFWVK